MQILCIQELIIEEMKNITIEDSVSHKIVFESRKWVITINQVLVYFFFIMSVVATYRWSWISIPVILVCCYIISVINSARAANKVKNTCGLSHSEQVEIWTKIKNIENR